MACLIWYVCVTWVALASGPSARDHLCHLHFSSLPQETLAQRAFVWPALGSCRCQRRSLGLVWFTVCHCKAQVGTNGSGSLSYLEDWESQLRQSPSGGCEEGTTASQCQPFARPENSISFLLGVRKGFVGTESILAVTEGASWWTRYISAASVPSN